MAVKYKSIYELNKKFNTISISENYHNEFKEIINTLINRILANEDVNFYYVTNVINQNINFMYTETLECFYTIIDNYIGSLLSNNQENANQDNCDITQYLVAWNKYLKLISAFNYLLFNYPNVKELIFNRLLTEFYNRILKMQKFATINNINKNNIETFIELFNSVFLFRKIEKVVDTNLTIIMDNLKRLIDSDVINICCEKVNKILYTTKDATKIKFYTKVFYHANRQDLTQKYHHFLQSRLMDKSYENYQEEIRLVNQFFKYDPCFKLFLYMIKNMMDNKSQINMLQGINVINTTMTLSEIPNIKNSKPRILYEKYWWLDNIYNLRVNYPREMKDYFLILDKFYKDKFNQEINWVASLGDALIEANINNHKIHITCNISQCICLLYFNKHSESSISQFASDCNIPKKKALQIFKSLMDANILILSLSNNYTINNNYQDDNSINVVSFFEY